jgi:hypothetical protein
MSHPSPPRPFPALPGGSDEFRAFVTQVTGCGDLSPRTDCSCNVYAYGGHLLCHDDVIANRRVSYIIYLTDPEDPWVESDGGALELYPLVEGETGRGPGGEVVRLEMSQEGTDGGPVRRGASGAYEGSLCLGSCTTARREDCIGLKSDEACCMHIGGSNHTVS